ncbi:hypothetical protein PJ311_01795 [Bacillus sp. CLL-7-23]|uniref:Uncharacterized protein n=1 Tax=Bacillus changyiensis TaxID=3004103 RepID=A0ABT4WZ69_9BACI|nr:hypothetical protein [Bacillus changyiensis]MDA7025340.1 hypothetical protein [Bacillus changyiensis]
MVKPLTDQLEKTETVSIKHKFLSSVSTADKVKKLNQPLHHINNTMTDYNQKLNDETDKQEGAIIKKIKEEVSKKSQNCKKKINRMKEDHQKLAGHYHTIIETLREQNMTVYYKKKVDGKA